MPSRDPGPLHAWLDSLSDDAHRDLLDEAILGVPGLGDWLETRP